VVSKIDALAKSSAMVSPNSAEINLSMWVPVCGIHGMVNRVRGFSLSFPNDEDVLLNQCWKSEK